MELVNECTITKVNDLDTQMLKLLVGESINEGFRHLKRLVTEYDAGTNIFDKEGEALFLAINCGVIVGVCALNQDPHSVIKEIGRVRRMYVSPQARRFGVGRMLIESVIAEARNHYRILVLKTDNPVADLFYQSMGFSVKVDHGNDTTHYLRLYSPHTRRNTSF